MDAAQIFATGGATGTVGVVLFLLYKFLTTHHRIRSNCFGKVVEIETEASSPPDKNISIVVDGNNGNPLTRHQANTHFFKKKDGKEDNKGNVSGSRGDEEVKGHHRPPCGEGKSSEGADTATEPVPEPRE